MTRSAPLLFALLLVLVGSTHAQAPDGPLQRSHVRDYIRLRTNIHQMQEKMKANADQYKNVTRVFFKRQKEYLRDEGWTYDGFDSVEKRIMAAESALEWAADSTARNAKHRRQLQKIENMSHLDAETREKMRAATVRQDSLYRAQHIEPTRRDWPAVRPYLDGLKHLTDYVAGNRSDPPALDALPPATP